MAHSGSLALSLAVFLAGCGARTSLEDDPQDGGPAHVVATERDLDAGRPDAATPALSGRCDCGDVQNPTATSDNCVHGVPWIVWEYMPACSFAVTSIELHTADGQVALLDDADNRPGATLARALLDGAGSSEVRWRRATFDAPVRVDGGRRYWIAEDVSVCSIAATGEAYPYFGGDSLAGPWSGPYTGHAFTSRISGACR